MKDETNAVSPRGEASERDDSGASEGMTPAVPAGARAEAAALVASGASGEPVEAAVEERPWREAEGGVPAAVERTADTASDPAAAAAAASLPRAGAGESPSEACGRSRAGRAVADEAEDAIGTSSGSAAAPTSEARERGNVGWSAAEIVAEASEAMSGRAFAGAAPCALCGRIIVDAAATASVPRDVATRGASSSGADVSAGRAARATVAETLAGPAGIGRMAGVVVAARVAPCIDGAPDARAPGKATGAVVGDATRPLAFSSIPGRAALASCAAVEDDGVRASAARDIGASCARSDRISGCVGPTRAGELAAAWIVTASAALARAAAMRGGTPVAGEASGRPSSGCGARDASSALSDRTDDAGCWATSASSDPKVCSPPFTGSRPCAARPCPSDPIDVAIAIAPVCVAIVAVMARPP